MNETQLRAFVRGYWENADHETKKGEPMVTVNMIFADDTGPEVDNDELDAYADFWYERGIKDLAEMVLAKLGEKE